MSGAACRIIIGSLRINTRRPGRGLDRALRKATRNTEIANALGANGCEEQAREILSCTGRMSNDQQIALRDMINSSIPGTTTSA